MTEIKLIELIKLPFKNIYLFLLISLIVLFLTYSLIKNFSKNYTFYGSYSIQFTNLDLTQKQIFKNYLIFNYGDNFVSKDTHFILYNIKHNKTPDNTGDFENNFTKILLKNFYESSFFKSYKLYAENENLYIENEINRIENSIKNINKNYLSLINDEKNVINYTANELKDVLKDIINLDGDLRSILVDLSKSIIDLKLKIDSNNYFLNKHGMIDGKLFSSQNNTNGFIFYMLSLIISLILCFIFNFARLKR